MHKYTHEGSFTHVNCVLLRVWYTHFALRTNNIVQFSFVVMVFFQQKYVLHYENMPMQYTAIFHGYKNNEFQMKNCVIFLIFAQNIDRGYTLEPPR